ncbi:hypothetical protein V8F06_001445 [Rhypophila decipiens]
MQQLELVLGELGITQYLDAFIDQGFDSWDTVLDITEGDLDTLGVKLGHRRKLQRRIANARALSANLSLGPTKRPVLDGARSEDAHRQEAPKAESRENGHGATTKRKYRRHPKPDENAPERPPSAYVLFSNKMRDDLKGRNLSFTEIAKLVGENWQSLSPSEKEPFESQANALKDKYQANLAEYRKTAEYRKYQEYLAEFKAKHGPISSDKESSKRTKLESGAISGSSTNATPNRASRSGSGSPRDSEPPPSRHQRLGSTVSVVDSQNSTTMTPLSYHHSVDMDSPKTVTTEIHSDRSPTFSTSPTEPPAPYNSRRDPSWPGGDDQRMDQRQDHTSAHRPLPSFADVFDGPNRLPSMGNPSDINGFPFPRTRTSPGPPPGLINGEHRPPFRHEQSGGSTSSSASSFGHPKTPVDGTLPIHSLLASKPALHAFEASQLQQTTFQPRMPSSMEHAPQQQQQHHHHHHHHTFPHQAPNGMGPSSLMNETQVSLTMIVIQGYHKEPSGPYPPVNNTTAAVAADGPSQPDSVYGGRPPPFSPSHPQPVTAAPMNRKQHHNPKLDGMSALLEAGEIVNRRAQ